jgi:hypothetical protein
MPEEPLDVSTTLTRSARAVDRRLQDASGVILDLETGGYFNVNGVGMVVWSVLEEPTSLADLMASVRARFPDAPPELEAEIRGFVDELRARGLIEVA